MRYLIAVEGHRDEEPYFIDITPEMIDAHPELAFKMGEVIGKFLIYGGKVNYG